MWHQNKPVKREAIGLRAALALCMLTVAGGQLLSSQTVHADEDYATARAGFHTTLRRTGPAPQEWSPTRTPNEVTEVQFQSGPLSLKAWLSAPPAHSVRYRAVLFLHGGFAFGEDDWQMTKAYREAGFVVMAPRLRGENGQAGNFTLFYDEVDDVLAAADYLRRLPYVDAARLFVAGHSVGGTLALLAALASDRFRAAASFSGSPNQYAFLNSLPRYAALAPFDPTDMRELQMRSPLSFAGHFRCPVRLFYGADEAEWFRSMNQRTAEIAKQHKADVESVQVPGDHFGAVPEAVRQSIEFFRQVAAK